MSKVGDKIQLSNQNPEVVDCDKCDNLMVNLDVDEVKKGDLGTLKKLGVRISNPETEDEICLKCDVEKKRSLRRAISDFFESDDDDDDDSGFFSSPTPSSSDSIFGGSSGGGGFGGFGGGSFSGGGAGGGF